VRSDLGEGETGEMILARSGRLRSPDTDDKDIVLELTDGTIHPVASSKEEYRSGSFRKLTSIISANPVKPDLSVKKLLMAASNDELRVSLAQLSPALGVKRAAKYSIELHRRLAFPFTILLYPFVIFPAAITLRKRGKAAAFTSSLFLFILSYLLFSVGSSMAYEGYISGALGSWTPDIFLGVLGAGIFLPYWIKQRSGSIRPSGDNQ
jgi:lipopolysaccharide export system permease protein